MDLHSPRKIFLAENSAFSASNEIGKPGGGAFSVFSFFFSKGRSTTVIKREIQTFLERRTIDTATSIFARTVRTPCRNIHHPSLCILFFYFILLSFFFIVHKMVPACHLCRAAVGSIQNGSRVNASTAIITLFGRPNHLQLKLGQVSIYQRVLSMRWSQPVRAAKRAGVVRPLN